MVATIKPAKRQRRLGIRILPKLDKYITRRPYPPGVHGQRRAGAMSDFGLQLQEKQRVKFIYGLREKQLRRLFDFDPTAILITLERRLDNVVFRSGLVNSRPQARQFINHGHIIVDDLKATIPSMLVKSGQKIKPKRPDALKLVDQQIPNWLEVDKKTKTITVKKIPQREDITSEINDQLIIEYYSR